VNARAHADRYAEIGLRVVPIKAGEKMPAVSRWVEAATTDPTQIDAWWPQGTTNGVGIVTGKASGIFALDVDINDNIDGGATLDGLEESYGKLPATWTSVTGSGGYHYLFAYPDDFELRNNASTKLGPGLDIRGEGGQIVAPPSVHAEGYAYRWETGCAPWECELAEAPDWMLTMLRPDEPPKPAPATASNLQNLHRGDDGEKPGDHFNQRHTGDEVLLRNGWTFSHRTQQGSHYTRPGKDPRAGTSATVYTNDGHTTIWSTSVGGVPLYEPMSPFGLKTFLEHGGNFGAAASELRRDGYGGERQAEPFPHPLTDGTVTPTNEGGGVEGGAQPVGADAYAATVLGESWKPQNVLDALAEDYEPVLPSVVPLIGGGHLLYAGRVNMIFGHSGHGKSWIAMAATAEVLRRGSNATYIDFEDHLAALVNRLRALGVEDTDIGRGLSYIQPDEPWSAASQAYATQAIEAHGSELVVIDSVGEAMAADNADPNSDAEVTRWMQAVPRTFSQLGPAVLLIDHSGKGKDVDKSFSAGSFRKRAAIDGVSFRVEPVTGHEPARGRLGRLALTCAKDRHGQFRVDEKSVNVTIEDVEGGTEVLLYKNTPGEENLTDAAEVFRLIVLGNNTREKVMKAIKAESDTGVGWRQDRVTKAVEVLISGGYVVDKRGKQGLCRVADFTPQEHRERENDRLLGIEDDHAA
jgi:hypothetical protein